MNDLNNAKLMKHYFFLLQGENGGFGPSGLAGPRGTSVSSCG